MQKHNMQFPLPSLLGMAPNGRLDMPEQYRGAVNALDIKIGCGSLNINYPMEQTLKIAVVYHN